MKNYFLLLSLTLITTVALAQRNTQTLLGDGVEFTSGFGGFMMQFPTIDGRLTAMTGGGGAAIINNTFYFGGYGLGLAEEVRVENEGVTYNLNFDHGGFFLGYIFNPEGMVHLGISSKFGWGGIYLNETIFTGGSFYQVNDRVFIINPVADVELNITNWFKFNVGAGYQLTNGVDNVVYNKTDFNGLTINASFLFGWFR
jgi:hypothetical protein